VVELLQRHDIDNLVLFTGYEEIVRAAMEHKVNVFAVDKPPALYFLYKYGIQDRFRESEPLYVGEFHRAVGKGNAALLKAVEAGFARISATEFKAIERRWYGASISSLIPYRLILPGACPAAAPDSGPDRLESDVETGGGPAHRRSQAQ